MTLLLCLYSFFRKFYQLGLPVEIKVQKSKSYETCKDRCKLSHINQTGQTTTWKETSIEFKKYRECRLWANIGNLWRFLFCKKNFFMRKKNIVETILVAIVDSSDVRCFDLYLNIFMKYTKAERCTNIKFKLTLKRLSTSFTKWSNTFKQFIGNLSMNCLSVFDHFVGLALKGLIVYLLLLKV